MKKIIFAIILIGAIIALILFASPDVESGNYGSSIQGDSTAVNVTFNAARDSAWIVFASPDDNPYDSVKAVPLYGASSRYLEAPYLDLDSLGGHSVVVRGFSGDAWVDTIHAEWNNFGAIALEPGSGFKTYPCTLEVLQTTDSSATAGVFITVRPLGGGTPFAIGTTDANGLFYYNSEIASVSAFLYKQGENTNAEDTVVIAGSQTDSLYSTTIVPPAPPADMVTIVMGLITANFDTLNPSYVWWKPVKSNGREYSKSDELYYGTGTNALAIQKQWTIETSTTSTFSFSVFANANLSDTLSQYEFWFYWADGRITQKITAVPDQASFNPIGQ